MTFRFRAGQEAMIATVGEAITSRRVLCIESGTGTGKTIGYLYPALRALTFPPSSSRPPGSRVVISTSTHALQEQIVRKDIPLLHRVLSLGENFPPVVVLKGRQNYLCLDRFDRWQQGLSRGPVTDTAHRILHWGRHTRDGERSEFPLPDQWEQFAVTADTCHGRDCQRYQDCFFMAARRQAAESSLLIVNHHLYFSDLLVRRSGGIGLLPEHEAVIFDEAHDLDDIVSSQFGQHLSHGMVRSLLRDIAHYWREHVTVPDPATLLADLDRQVGRYWEGLSGLLRGRSLPVAGRERSAGDRNYQKTVCLPSFDAPQWDGLRQTGEYLAHRMGQLSDWFAGCSEDADLPARSRLPAARLADRCQSTGDAFRLFQAARAEDHAYWAVQQEDMVQELRRTPLEIDQTLREHLFTSGRAVVFVSATLTVQSGSFAFFQSRMGCPPETMYRRIRSPFAYDRQALLYLPPDLPSPNDAGFVPAAFPTVRRLLELTGGRTLLLCTSFAHLEYFHKLLVEMGTFPVFRQGDASPRELIERFQKTSGAVLMGAMTFWQGVDIPGDSLCSVIIDRIPFPSPSDPVVHFRHAYLEKQGHSPFLEDSLPRALLMLRQGFGRLIRSETDQGIVTILDPRSHRYQGAILSTLPGGLPVCHRWDDLVQRVSGWPTVYRGGMTASSGSFPDRSFPDGSFPDGSFPDGSFPDPSRSFAADGRGRHGLGRG